MAQVAESLPLTCETRIEFLAAGVWLLSDSACVQVGQAFKAEPAADGRLFFSDSQVII